MLRVVFSYKPRIDVMNSREDYAMATRPASEMCVTFFTITITYLHE